MYSTKMLIQIVGKINYGIVHFYTLGENMDNLPK